MMFEDKILIFDERYYNLDEKIFFAKSFRIYTSDPIDLDWVRENTVIIHYNGSHKPWKGKKYFGRLGEYFEKYNSQTHVYGRIVSIVTLIMLIGAPKRARQRTNCIAAWNLSVFIVFPPS